MLFVTNKEYKDGYFNEKYKKYFYYVSYQCLDNFEHQEYTCNVGYLGEKDIDLFNHIYDECGGLFVFIFYWAPNCKPYLDAYDEFEKELFRNLRKEPYPIICPKEGDPVFFGQPFFIEMKPTKNMKKTFKQIRDNWLDKKEFY